MNSSRNLNDATTVLLVRHGHTDALGHRLVGRLPDVALTPHGHAQAIRLVERLARYAVSAIYTSPLQRATETARPLASARDLELRLRDDLMEVEFGDWTGRTFSELDRDPTWHTFNTSRASAAVPRGETAVAVQTRITSALDSIAASHPGRTVVVVSHADVIRAAVLNYSGISLDDFQRIEISPASITAVLMRPPVVRILYINEEDVDDPLQLR
jgi:probable phosphoglycerate mutase